MTLLSRRGYARHSGRSWGAVWKAIRDGRITVRDDGLIDSDVADREWAANTNEMMQRDHPSPGDPDDQILTALEVRYLDSLTDAELKRFERDDPLTPAEVAKYRRKWKLARTRRGKRSQRPGR